jgi:transposase
MISKNTVELLTEDNDAPFDYILGCRMRNQKEVKEEVLTQKGRYEKVSDNLEVKEVKVRDRRYIVCRNEEEAQKDRLSREAIIEQLAKKLKTGQINLIGNHGFRRYLKGKKGAWEISEGKIKEDARFDGIFVLRTSLDLPVREIAKTYKGLWRVERIFREEKSTLAVRPLYHQSDEMRIGHIVASFLALRLEIDLQRRLEEKGIDVNWKNLMRDLKRLKAVKMNQDGKGYLVRTDFEGKAYEAFKAAGVRAPRKVTPLSDVPMPSKTEKEICSAEKNSEKLKFFNLNTL